MGRTIETKRTNTVLYNPRMFGSGKDDGVHGHLSTRGHPDSITDPEEAVETSYITWNGESKGKLSWDLTDGGEDHTRGDMEGTLQRSIDQSRSDGPQFRRHDAHI
ncbi:hypothetical protein FS842_006932 [Serendipita sp. 407]|nr:hypothetical protein FS842_006932 [Serendipita sp. 407]